MLFPTGSPIKEGQSHHSLFCYNHEELGNIFSESTYTIVLIFPSFSVVTEPMNKEPIYMKPKLIKHLNFISRYLYY